MLFCPVVGLALVHGLVAREGERDDLQAVAAHEAEDGVRVGGHLGLDFWRAGAARRKSRRHLGQEARVREVGEPEDALERPLLAQHVDEAGNLARELVVAQKMFSTAGRRAVAGDAVALPDVGHAMSTHLDAKCCLQKGAAVVARHAVAFFVFVQNEADELVLLLDGELAGAPCVLVR